jgi:hypothetical protein
VAHLAEDELVGAYRIRLILSEPDIAIQAFDQDAWAVIGRYAQIEPQVSLALFRSLRPETVRAYGLSASRHKATESKQEEH